MNPRIVELSKVIAEAQAEIARIREACPHEHETPGWYSWRIGSLDWRMICDECGKPGEACAWKRPAAVVTVANGTANPRWTHPDA